MIPEYWSQFLTQHDLVGRSFQINGQVDLSGLGAELQFLNPQQSIDEATHFWPGIGVSRDGYVPVAMCLLGSGDYYYINSNDGPRGPLYRVYHDAVNESGYDPKDAITVVLNNYETLLSDTNP